MGLANFASMRGSKDLARDRYSASSAASGATLYFYSASDRLPTS